jgi:hypothetical protein
MCGPLCRAAFLLVLLLAHPFATEAAAITVGKPSGGYRRPPIDWKARDPVENASDFTLLERAEALERIGDFNDLHGGYTYKENVVVPAALATRSLVTVLEASIETPLVSLFVETNTHDYRLLKSVANDRVESFPADYASVNGYFADRKGKVVILIGHLVGSLLIKTNTDGTRVALDINKLGELAEAQNVLLQYLSCRAGLTPGISGPIDDLWTPEIVDRIRAALKARTFGDTLVSLGTPDTPFLIGGSVMQSASIAMTFVSTTTSTNGIVSISGGAQIPTTHLQDASNSSQDDAATFNFQIFLFMIIGVPIFALYFWSYGLEQRDAAVAAAPRPFVIRDAKIYGLTPAEFGSCYELANSNGPLGQAFNEVLRKAAEDMYPPAITTAQIRAILREERQFGDREVWIVSPDGTVTKTTGRESARK